MSEEQKMPGVPGAGETAKGAPREEAVEEAIDNLESADPAEELPSQDLLDQDLVRILLEPPDLGVGRELARDVGRRLKRVVPPLLLAEALIRLSPQQRGSRPQDRTFVRAALLQRLQQAPGWMAQPILQHLPDEREDGEGLLEDGTWSWRLEGFSIHPTETGRWGVLHLWLKNDLDSIGVGQPVAVVLVDAIHSYTWSPMASRQVLPDQCPDGCSGSLASVALEANAEILGHLSFPIPADARPEAWGLQMGHHAHLRLLPGPGAS